jgi:hypothetical protein
MSHRMLPGSLAEGHYTHQRPGQGHRGVEGATIGRSGSALEPARERNSRSRAEGAKRGEGRHIVAARVGREAHCIRDKNTCAVSGGHDGQL